MHADHLIHSNTLLPLEDAIVLAQQPYWEQFSADLLGRRVTIVQGVEALTADGDSRNPAIIALDDSDIKEYVYKAWAEPSIRELIVILPIPEAHTISLKSMSHNNNLGNQLECFTRIGELLALKFIKDAQTDWTLERLLQATAILSQFENVDNVLETSLREEIADHLETLRQLIELSSQDEREDTAPDSLELTQLQEQNARLQSKNASLRLQADTLERKYNTLANSRLGKITLKRWKRK